jgi:hypothetical protein
MKKEDLSDYMRQGNVALILDSYDDIFSDFDPRQYHEKAISDDFLHECEKAVKDKEEQFEITFMVPKNKRSIQDESRIKKRLKHHFFHRFHEKEKEIKTLKREGWSWFALGTIFILATTYIYEKQGFFFNLLEIVLTPAGWFTFWEGLAKIFITAREKKPKHEFYKKMTQSILKFESY